MVAWQTLTLVKGDDKSRDIRPVVMDLVFASSATCAISHSVPSINLPQTDKQRPQKNNESIGKTKIFQRFHSTTGDRATPSGHSAGTVSSFILTKRNGWQKSFSSLCARMWSNKLARRIHKKLLCGQFFKLHSYICGQRRALKRANEHGA